MTCCVFTLYKLYLSENNLNLKKKTGIMGVAYYVIQLLNYISIM
jgi:hypothetical protein